MRKYSCRRSSLKNGLCIRAILGSLALLALSAYEGARLAKGGLTLDVGLSAETSLVRYLSRFDSIKGELAPYEVYGYAAKVSPEDIHILRNQEALAKYYVTQYALAPAIIDKSPSKELIIGNFDNPDEARGSGLTVLAEYGNGVALLKREGQ